MTPNAQPEAGKKRTSGLMYLNETHKSKMTQQLKLDFFFPSFKAQRSCMAI